MKTIAALLTVFNRKEKTLHCLDNFFLQQLPEGIILDVYLVDDGCTDGTSEAVKEKFPSVHIIQGTGNLFWNRGMHLAWQTASETQDYDYYLWMNDDTFIYTDAITNLLDCSKEVNDKSLICGILCSEDDKNKTTYGSWYQGQLLNPNGRMQEADIINGNIVLVPNVVYQTVGMLDPVFPHAIGDFDYGLRARKKGFRCFSTKNYIGTCESNPKLPKWCYASTPLSERWKSLYSPLGYAHPKYFFIYEKRNFGILTAVKHYLSIHLRVIFPQLWA